MVKRRFAGPKPAKQADILIRAGVTLILVEKITIALLLGIIRAGYGQVSAAHLTQADEKWVNQTLVPLKKRRIL